MSADAKPKFAMYWAAACGGCEIAVLNTHETILDVDANFDVVFWPVAMDAKYKDVDAMPDKSITLTLFNGAIRNSENEHIAKLLRQKSQILVAFGSCAYQGGIPGLGNLATKEEILETAFSTLSTDNHNGVRPQPNYHVPEGELHIPQMHETVKSLDQVVAVDYYMPGCPPESAQINTVVGLVIQALKGQAALPPAGAIIGVTNSTVCDECTRTRQERTIGEFRRIATYQPNTNDCLLEQGVLCCGIATRGGCNARCPSANMPCIGCYGPAPDVVDQGARMLSAVASVIDSKNPQEIDKIVNGIVDPVGTFYRFGLPGSLLRASRRRHA
ncbi:MAG: oxidoreductase [Chloroflexi bacterium]|nr:oxidoreductase [Chloroflexota bacterium]